MNAARILRPEEWERLERLRFPQLLPYVRPENMAVVVVEEGGEIVACVSVALTTVFEGLWVHPWQRGNAGVGRALLRQAVAIPRARGEQWIFGGVEADSPMPGFVERLGATRIPLDFYAVSLMTPEERESWQSHPSQP